MPQRQVTNQGCVVKCLVWVLLMIFSVTARASDVLLVPVFTPKPQFPAALLKERYTGKVFAHITIGNTGYLRAIHLIESSHESFSEAATKAMGQWRFEPWEVKEGRPEELGITLPIIFGAEGIKPFSAEITVGLGNTTCAYLNNEVRMSKKDYPHAPLSEVDVFWYNRYYLGSSYIVYRAPGEGAREKLYSALRIAIPAVVKGCAGSKTDKYSDHLPDELRSLLVL